MTKKNTPNSIPKNTTISQSGLNPETIKLIQDSGILNAKMPLEEVFNLNQRVASLHPADPKIDKGVGQGGVDVRKTFIHRHFIYSHADS